MQKWVAEPMEGSCWGQKRCSRAANYEHLHVENHWSAQKLTEVFMSNAP